MESLSFALIYEIASFNYYVVFALEAVSATLAARIKKSG
jgi:hypothetical protein